MVKAPSPGQRKAVSDTFISAAIACIHSSGRGPSSRHTPAGLPRNGEAVYESRPWKVFGEGPTKTPEGHLADLGFNGFGAEDIRFTQSKDGRTLYTILFGWPQDGEVLIRSLHPKHGEISSVSSIVRSNSMAAIS